MTNSTPPAPSPNGRQLLAVVALAAVLLAGVVALYALTPQADRPAMFDRLATLLPTVGAFATGAAAWLGIRRVRDEHGQQLAQITHQTNGVLTARITSAVADALAVAHVGDRRHTTTTPTKEGATHGTAAQDHAANAG